MNVLLYLYICMYVCFCINLFVISYIYIYIYISLSLSLSLSLYIYIYMHIYISHNEPTTLKKTPPWKNMDGSATRNQRFGRKGLPEGSILGIILFSKSIQNLCKTSMPKKLRRWCHNGSKLIKEWESQTDAKSMHFLERWFNPKHLFSIELQEFL